MEERNGCYFPPSKSAAQLSPLVLAYMGDAIYEAFIRQYLISLGNYPVNQLHRDSIRFVSAKGQAKALERLMTVLSEEEKAVVKRGRNAKSGMSPKNTDIVVYRHSTAFECLLGYLFFSGRQDRLEQLMRLTLENDE